MHIINAHHYDHFYLVIYITIILFFCRFQVDFIKGQDVVFHFNPRFYEQTIVRNSNLGGSWGPEEREGGFPFVEGRRFEVKCYGHGTAAKIRKLKSLNTLFITEPLNVSVSHTSGSSTQVFFTFSLCCVQTRLDLTSLL